MITSNNRLDRVYNICKVFLTIAIFTASFDLILIVRVGGNALRLSQLCIAISAVCLIYIVFYNKNIYLPIGWKELLALLIINGIFCFNAQHKVRSFGYEVWFLLNVLLVVITVNIFNTEKAKIWIVKMWALSGVVMSTFGLIQLFFGMAGISLFAEQWTHSFLPRLNGLCSEPSYFACYLIPFFVFFAYVVENDDETIFKKKTNFIFYGLISTVIIFSTSRMGLLMVVSWLAFRLIAMVLLKKYKKLQRIVIMATVVMAAFFTVSWVTEQDRHVGTDYIERYSDFAGSGVERVFGMLSALEVAKESPIIGYSLGGVLEECAEYAEKVDFKHPLLSQKSTALFVSNVTAELFAAWGILGVTVLAIYFYKLWGQGYSKKIPKDIFYTLKIGILWGFIWQFGILQFNNNFMRVYVWSTIAILSILCSTNKIKLSKNNK